MCYLRDSHSFPTRRSSDLGCDKNQEVHLGLGQRPIIGQPSRPARATTRCQVSSHHIRFSQSSCARHVMTSLSVEIDRKSTRLNSSHQIISYAVFCLKKKKK